MKPVRSPALALAACLACAAPAAASAPERQYYLSLGDSLSVGVQPGPADDPGHAPHDVITNQGYSHQLYRKAKPLYPGLRLVKAGCSSATSENFLHGGANVVGQVGCTPRQPLYASQSTATSQMTYATRFLREHRGHIAFITVSIGNNDLYSCQQGDAIDLQCVSDGTASIATNVRTIGKRLRALVGPRVPIIGSTFYDPFLGFYPRGGALAADAQASQGLAMSINEDTLIPAWTANRIDVARIDEAFGTYIPFDQTVDTADFGPLPIAVANICRLTWFCAPPPVGPDVHARRAGYRVMAEAFYRVLRGKR
jgi:lysophospholipase L1-like esterase